MLNGSWRRKSWTLSVCGNRSERYIGQIAVLLGFWQSGEPAVCRM